MGDKVRTLARWVSPRVRRTAVALSIGLFSFALMASRPPAETLHTVRILDGNSYIELLSEPMTVQKRFLESRIRLSRFDRVTPPLSTIIGKDMTIRILRGAEISDRPRSVETPFEEKIVASRRIPAGSGCRPR